MCAIHGTHFATYVRYLTALGTPWSVVTDDDPKPPKKASEGSASVEEPEAVGDAEHGEKSEEIEGTEDFGLTDDEDEQDLAGTVRAQRLLKILGKHGVPEDFGIFVGDVTLELDLLEASRPNRELCLQILSENDWARPTATKIQTWVDGSDVPPKEYMRIVERFGKGRFAQRLAARKAPLQAPRHVAAALKHLLP